MAGDAIRKSVERCLRAFMEGVGRDIEELDDSTDLITGTGATSDEGVDFAIDLSDALGADVPHDFNPFVHESGKRGMKFGELVERAKKFVAARKEEAHGE